MPSNIKLNHIVSSIPVEHMQRSTQLYLPTEVVVTSPELVVPKVARVYHTRMYALDDRLVSYQELVEFKKDTFRGTAFEDEVLAWEVWVNDGSDGHLRFSLRGYIYIVEDVRPIPEDGVYPVNTMESFFYQQKA